MVMSFCMFDFLFLFSVIKLEIVFKFVMVSFVFLFLWLMMLVIVWVVKNLLIISFDFSSSESVDMKFVVVGEEMMLVFWKSMVMSSVLIYVFFVFL